MNSDALQKYAAEFYQAVLVKIAFIRKQPNGKWRVLSEKGKNLGEYDSEKAAKIRLRQIEFWKWKKASDDSLSYSSVIRMLNKEYDEKTVDKFQKLFKEYFDRSYLCSNHEEPEQEALEKALRHMPAFHKKASGIEMGDPNLAGKKMSELVQFLLRRIPEDKRGRAIQSVRRKIYQLDENDIAGKKTPPSASLGSAITVIKTILLEHKPEYIRQVLNAIVRNL